MEEVKQKKIRVQVSIGSKIVGKTINGVEKKFKICILELDNTNDRAFLFSWEIKPSKSAIIQSGDEIIVFGKTFNIRRFSKSAASLN